MFDIDKMISGIYGPDLDKVISEAYDNKEPMSFGDLAEMVENMLVLQESLGQYVSGNNLIVEREALRNFSITYSNLPNVNVSELGWANPDGEVQEIDGAAAISARSRMETLLEPYIETQMSYPASLKRTIRRISSVFPREFDERNLKEVLPQEQTDIDNNLNLIMAYKTLTEIVRNFGAAPAGFVFESFISILLGGKQVPTGQQTIADLTTDDGIPVSLKLLKPGGAVKGSYTDLINDLARGDESYKNIFYLVAIKRTFGTGLNVSGAVDFFNFVINAQSLLDLFLSGGAEKARSYIRLPVKNNEIFIPSSLISEQSKAGKFATGTRKKFSLWLAETPKEKNISRAKDMQNKFAENFSIKVPKTYFELFKLEDPNGKLFQEKYFNLLEKRRISQPPVKDVKTLFKYFIEGSDYLENRRLGNQFKGRFSAFSNLVLRDILIEQVDSLSEDNGFNEKYKNELKSILSKIDHRLQSYTNDLLTDYILKYNEARLQKANLSLREKTENESGPAWYNEMTNKAYMPEEVFFDKVPYGINKATFKAALEKSSIIKKISMSDVRTQVKLFLESLIVKFNNLGTEYAEDYEKEVPEMTPEEFGFDSWASPEVSADYMRSLAPEQMIKALRVSYGMVNKKNWAFSVEQLKNARNNYLAGIADIADTQNQAGEVYSESLLKENIQQDDPYLGSIYVGVNNVVKLAEAVSYNFNQQIFYLFEQLNVLTTNLEKFYSSGLKQGGEKARKASSNIENSFNAAGALKQKEAQSQTASPDGRSLSAQGRRKLRENNLTND